MSYIPATTAQQREMLKACGISSINELFSDIPKNLAPKSFSLPAGKSIHHVNPFKWTFFPSSVQVPDADSVVRPPSTTVSSNVKSGRNVTVI